MYSTSVLKYLVLRKHGWASRLCLSVYTLVYNGCLLYLGSLSSILSLPFSLLHLHDISHLSGYVTGPEILFYWVQTLARCWANNTFVSVLLPSDIFGFNYSTGSRGTQCHTLVVFVFVRLSHTPLVFSIDLSN